MNFKSVENDGGLMKPGDYEVYVKSCAESLTKSGNECIAFDFVIRADVDQPYQNKHVFKNFYRLDATGEYDAVKIGKYANALGIEKGQDFELSDLVGRNCIIHIEHFTGNDGITRECIYYTAKSKAEAFVAPAPTFDELPDEDDDQLPF